MPPHVTAPGENAQPPDDARPPFLVEGMRARVHCYDDFNARFAELEKRTVTRPDPFALSLFNEDREDRAEDAAGGAGPLLATRPRVRCYADDRPAYLARLAPRCPLATSCPLARAMAEPGGGGRADAPIRGAALAAYFATRTTLPQPPVTHGGAVLSRGPSPTSVVRSVSDPGIPFY
jgi:hypothetical protein